jgi:hypothetical protein
MRRDFDPMATSGQLIDGFHSNPRLDTNEIRDAAVGSEESGKMLAAEFGGLDRISRGHAENGPIEKELQLPLILLVAAHTAECHPCIPFREAMDGLIVVRGLL